ncbi:MAG: DMT family transporter [Clostridium sp.]
MKGHLLAMFTIFIWGNTFVSTKVLLEDFSPYEVLLTRFLIGFIVLLVAYPKIIKFKSKSEEVYFALAGICGVTLYFLFENIALTYTLTSNVGVIVSVSPFITALITSKLVEKSPLKKQFIVGFLVAMAGIILITYNTGAKLDVNPIGDILALLAAIVWSLYSILTNKISTFGYTTIQSTRRIFFYGIIFMLPFMMWFNINPNILDNFKDPVNTFNILFLGVGASALCFATWNKTLDMLGTVKTSMYIYAIPVITVITSIIVLNESLTAVSFIGMMLTIIGLIISEWEWSSKDEKTQESNVV